MYYYDGANKYILNQNDYDKLNQNIQTISSNLNSVISNSVKYGRGTFSNASSYTVRTGVTSFALLIVCAIFYDTDSRKSDYEFIFLTNNSSSNVVARDGTSSVTRLKGALTVTNNGFTITDTSASASDEGGQYYYAYFT